MSFIFRNTEFSQKFLQCSRYIYGSSHILTNKKNSPEDIKAPAPENPFNRTVRILKDDVKKMKSFFTPLKPSNVRRGNTFISEHCDIVIIGGGVVGSSIAFWLRNRVYEGANVIVVEKDPSYSTAATTLSCGGIRQQFSEKENIEMSLFGAEFLRQIKDYLSVDGHPAPNVEFTPSGYLFLASEAGAEQLEINAETQLSVGAKVELLSPKKLKAQFPWLNTDGIALGCHGLENEGWIDPWSLLTAFKRKALSLGVEYINAEAVGFEFTNMPDIIMEGIAPGSYETLDRLLIRTETGEIKPIKFGVVIIAAGPNSGNVAKLAKIGTEHGYRSIPLPVEPRKRYVYCVHCPDGPGINTPFLIDSSGVYCRREGLAGNYLCGMSPNPDEEPETNNLEVDFDFFNNNIWPRLASRAPAFENLKVKSAWSGFYDYNIYDANAIVGPHPYYHNLYFATGFSGHGLQHAPAVGRAVMEMVFEGNFRTIDMSRFGFDRLLYDEPIYEQNIV